MKKILDNSKISISGKKNREKNHFDLQHRVYELLKKIFDF
jgi:hypothetical protein